MILFYFHCIGGDGINEVAWILRDLDVPRVKLFGLSKLKPSKLKANPKNNDLSTIQRNFNYLLIIWCEGGFLLTRLSI